MSLEDSTAKNLRSDETPPKRPWNVGYFLIVVSIYGAAENLVDFALKCDAWTGLKSWTLLENLLRSIDDAIPSVPWSIVFLSATVGFLFTRIGSWMPTILHPGSWFRNLKREAEKREIQSQIELTTQLASLHEAACKEHKMRQTLHKSFATDIIGTSAEWPQRLPTLESLSGGDPDEWDDEQVRNSGWIHADQVSACRKAPRYQMALTIMPRLLKMPPEEFAKRMKSLGFELPLPVAHFLFKRPELLPKPDLWEPITKALWIDNDFFENGEIHKYSKEHSVARLKRFHAQGRALVHTFMGYEGDPESLKDYDNRRIQTIIKRVETALLFDENVTTDEGDV